MTLQVKAGMSDKDKAQVIKINQAIDDMANDRDIKQIVKDIEGRIKTTKGHYGDYLAFLSNFQKDSIVLFIMKEALLRCGADVEGINGAMMILKPKF
jgi:hypothetical protein